jgi:hypothetical protein
MEYLNTTYLPVQNHGITFYAVDRELAEQTAVGNKKSYFPKAFQPGKPFPEKPNPVQLTLNRALHLLI